MIQAAQPHAGAIQAAYQKAYNDPKFQWFFGAYADTNIVIPTSDWAQFHYASVNDKGEVCGHLWADLDRDARTVDSIGAINFNPGHSVTFAMDLRRFFARLICGGWERVSWDVNIGNPAEAMYDKGVVMLGGRIVGTRKKWKRDRITGAHRDNKMYEVLPEDVPPAAMAYLRKIDPLRTWAAK